MLVNDERTWNGLVYNYEWRTINNNNNNNHHHHHPYLNTFSPTCLYCFILLCLLLSREMTKIRRYKRWQYLCGSRLSWTLPFRVRELFMNHFMIISPDHFFTCSLAQLISGRLQRMSVRRLNALLIFLTSLSDRFKWRFPEEAVLRMLFVLLLSLPLLLLLLLLLPFFARYLYLSVSSLASIRSQLSLGRWQQFISADG